MISVQRRYKVYRGERLLGYVGFDDQWPGDPRSPRLLALDALRCFDADQRRPLVDERILVFHMIF
ncbi:hypothetical protein [Roseimaritima sediminicola]|uniref:hypothetical protein n=1 Tax=Roseimaritima sediminicola TaxID=2662066 RepID=UPI0012982D5D|nr:hypothetical protein [Roseimaritima sediminicola]